MQEIQKYGVPNELKITGYGKEKQNCNGIKIVNIYKQDYPPIIEKTSF